MKNASKTNRTSAKPRKPRADSVSGAKIAMAAALAGVLQPPEHIRLTKRDIPFWNSIMSARARQLWTGSDLELAAHLARAKSRLEQFERDMELEPLTLKTETGRIYRNPKREEIEELSRRIAQYSRLLHVHAQSTVGRSRDNAGKLDEENRKKAVIAGLRSTNSLIKMPEISHS